MGIERLTDPKTQITGNVYQRVVQRCCNPLCPNKATWVRSDGKKIWCGEHAPFEEEW